MVAARNACTANKKGATNKNVNSNGSVMPTSTAVNTAGISRPATLCLFSGAAVIYIAPPMPIQPKAQNPDVISNL